MIDLCALSCFFGNHSVLHDISVTLRSGCIALVGPNGAGKSTLLRLCADAGRYFPQARITGDVLLDDEPLKNMSPALLAQRRAFLPQQHADSLRLPVHELLQLAAWPHGGSSRQIETVYQQALQAWELNTLAYRHYDELSGGERQRVQLARTWLQMRLHENAHERIWLLDEPQNSLDLPQQQRLRQHLRHEGSSGALVIFSTHDINFALRSADQILVLKAGKLQAFGTPDDIANPLLLQEAFGVGFDKITHPVDGKIWLLPH
jgi:iron complex transport system ATP-binding protein